MNDKQFCWDGLPIEIFEIICDEAKEADRRAEEACTRSKYSIQDYWMCIEIRMQRLADRIARKYKIEKRCPIYPFRSQINDFRRNIIKQIPENTGGD